MNTENYTIISNKDIETAIKLGMITDTEVKLFLRTFAVARKLSGRGPMPELQKADVKDSTVVYEAPGFSTHKPCEHNANWDPYDNAFQMGDD